MESKNPDIIAQFLIAEFNALQERAKNFEDIKASRVNFFLLVVAAVGAIFSTANQIDLLKQYYIESIILTALVLLLLGLSTLKHSVDYSGATVILFRLAGRVRRWFVDFDEKVAPYVAFEPADDRPKFSISYSLLAWRGAETVVMLFNAISFTTIAGCIVFKIFQFTQIIAVIILVGVAVSTWYLQGLYVSRKMLKVQNSDSELRRIHFPHEDNAEKVMRQHSSKSQSETKFIDSDTLPPAVRAT